MRESTYKKKIEYNQRVHKLNCKDGKYYCRAVHAILDKSKHGIICGKGCPCFARIDVDGGIICEYYDLDTNIAPCTPKQNKQRAQVLIDSKIAPLFPNVWLKEGSRKTRMEKAFVFVLNEYGKRKIFKKPYIQIHLIEVANIIMQLTSDVNILIAGILHDVLERNNSNYYDSTQYELVEREFGVEVSDMLKYGLDIKDKMYKNDANEYVYKKLIDKAPNNVKILRFADTLAHLKESCDRIENRIDNTNDINKLVQYYDEMKKAFKEFEDMASYEKYNEYLDKLSNLQ